MKNLIEKGLLIKSKNDKYGWRGMVVDFGTNPQGWDYIKIEDIFTKNKDKWVIGLDEFNKTFQTV
jgi:hypothetical protein|tara:strand:- start:277 stop:471 length:195 start_codon:yes stop_codon:yes gene_type:complete